MSGDTDKLAQIANRQEDEPGAGYITLLPEERDALVEIAKAARQVTDSYGNPESFTECTFAVGGDYVNRDACMKLRAALSALDGDT